MEKYKLAALIGSIMVLIATIGFMTVIPSYDTFIRGREFNIEQSTLSKVIAENYVSTYTILKEVNASKEALDFAYKEYLNNFKLAISSQDLRYKKEPLKSELNSINDTIQLNDLFLETADTFANEYNTAKNEQSLFYNIFLVFNSLGLLLVAISPLMKKESSSE